MRTAVMLFFWMGSHCSPQVHQPLASQAGSVHFRSQGDSILLLLRAGAAPLRVEQEFSLEEGPSCCVDPLHEAWLCAIFPEISWIHEVSDVIWENAPKVYLK